MRELSTFIGYIALNGGRLVTLASALSIVAKHIKLGVYQKNKPEVTEESTERPPEKTLEDA